MNASVTGTNVEEFVEAAREGLAIQTQSHRSVWGFGEEATWSADLELGTIAFDFANGSRVTAPIQVVGSYNTNDSTFLWGWDHPSVPSELARHAELVKRWGEECHAPSYTQRKFECSEDDAWSFAAVANRLGEGNGVYRGVAGSAYFFMTLGRLTIDPGKA